MEDWRGFIMHIQQVGDSTTQIGASTIPRRFEMLVEFSERLLGQDLTDSQLYKFITRTMAFVTDQPTLPLGSDESIWTNGAVGDEAGQRMNELAFMLRVASSLVGVLSWHQSPPQRADLLRLIRNAKRRLRARHRRERRALEAQPSSE